MYTLWIYRACSAVADDEPGPIDNIGASIASILGIPDAVVNVEDVPV